MNCTYGSCQFKLNALIGAISGMIGIMYCFPIIGTQRRVIIEPESEMRKPGQVKFPPETMRAADYDP